MQYVIGSFVFAIAISLGVGIITYVLLKIFRRKRTVSDFEIPEITNLNQ
jgi:xanthine/uracil/vitamin C permease (AzgA family)